MTPEVIVSLITALAAGGSAIAAIIAAVNSWRSKAAATEARDLVKQVIAVQQANTQTTTQQTNVHFHGLTTRELIFPPGELPGPIPAALAGGSEQPQQKAEPSELPMEEKKQSRPE